jgi:copper chaperone CopZ
MNRRPRLLVFLAVSLLWLTRLTTLAAEESPGTPGLSAPPTASVIGANVTNRFEIRGMHCGGCAAGITAELKLVSGVVSAEVSFPKRLAVVAYDTNRVSQSQLVKVVHEAGYTAVPLSGRKGRRR